MGAQGNGNEHMKEKSLMDGRGWRMPGKKGVVAAEQDPPWNKLTWSIHWTLSWTSEHSCLVCGSDLAHQQGWPHKGEKHGHLGNT